MNPQDILPDLIANAELPGTSNAGMSACVQNHLSRAGVKFTVLPGPEGDRDNIFATLGPQDQPGYLLSGHMDVVSVAGQLWSTDPFRLTERNGTLFGRGTSDMKGFLACMLATAYSVDGDTLARPLHMAFSYDEEIGCRGVGHMIKKLPELCAPPLGCIIGEPSNMVPVLSHKGKQAIVLNFNGKAAHSSDPKAGLNAIYPAAELALFVRSLNAELSSNGPFDAHFTPAHSTVVSGIMTGGVAINIVPDACSLKIECRAIPQQSPAEIMRQITAFAERSVTDGTALSVDIDILSQYPALPPPRDGTLTQLMEKLTRQKSISAVSYGTEAGIFAQSGLPSIICGPGSISRAHRPDEYITRLELEKCYTILMRLAATLAS